MARVRTTAKFLGFDLSTTALAVGVRSEEGKEDFVSVPMRGAKKWRRQPGFDVNLVPDMILEVLEKLRSRGWRFSPDAGALSFSVRQHDMVFVGDDFRLLLPALSWQCNAAIQEVEDLQKMGAERYVGRIEPRFILPKAMWALRQKPTLGKKIHALMTTGDYATAMLTGNCYLSTSDALSNGLLYQKSKSLARIALGLAGLLPYWFPPVIQSGSLIGRVVPPDKRRTTTSTTSWEEIRRILSGWLVVAGLGDNHAGAVGCGLKDFETIVVSGGSSGTVVRQSENSWLLAGKAACFEYYKNRLLLMMLPDCAVWYDRFVERFGRGRSIRELDKLALQADVSRLLRVRQEETTDKRGKRKWREVYPDGWNKLPLREKVASTQASIVLELLELIKKMLSEITGSGVPSVKNFVLTGGLSRSLFFQEVFEASASSLTVGSMAFLSDHQGPLAHKAAALGAMINAMLGTGRYPNLESAINNLCPLRTIPRAPTEKREQLKGCLRRL